MWQRRTIQLNLHVLWLSGGGLLSQEKHECGGGGEMAGPHTGLWQWGVRCDRLLDDTQQDEAVTEPGLQSTVIPVVSLESYCGDTQESTDILQEFHLVLLRNTPGLLILPFYVESLSVVLMPASVFLKKNIFERHVFYLLTFHFTIVYNNRML